jgi:hypothetical protein
MRTRMMFPTLWLVATALACTGSGSTTGQTGQDAVALTAPIPLKEAKLNIEHNATDLDTGFQGFVDSEGWRDLEVRAPDGTVVLRFEALGSLASLGLTELFFETVEPANADVPIAEVLAKLPEGRYTFEGTAIVDGLPAGVTSGTALLTHDIPAGPVLLSPAADAIVPATGLVVSWSPVTQTITGKNIRIIAYQLIVEKVQAPDPHMIGNRGSLSMYLPPTVTSIPVPDGFLERRTDYDWEVLAIEDSGNQTLSSGSFRTE